MKSKEEIEWQTEASHIPLPSPMSSLSMEDSSAILISHMALSMATAYSDLCLSRSTKLFNRYQTIPIAERKFNQRLSLATYTRTARGILTSVNFAAVRFIRYYLENLIDDNTEKCFDLAERLELSEDDEINGIWKISLVDEDGPPIPGLLDDVKLDKDEPEPTNIEYYYLENSFCDDLTGLGIPRKSRIGWYHHATNPRVHTLVPASALSLVDG